MSGVRLEGQGDLVGRLKMGIHRVTMWGIRVFKLKTYLLCPPDPSSRV